MSGDRSRENGFDCLRRGDAVTVRSLDEILATLDRDVKLDGLPFMPEMIPFCGRTFQVHRRAEKTCVEGHGLRAMRNTAFLDGVRCDGSAHGGCQRGCLFFWKEAWLEAVGSRQSAVGSGQLAKGGRRRAEGEEDASQRCCQATNFVTPRADPSAGLQSSLSSPSELPTTKGERFYCQSTELAGATSDFPPGKLRHYLRDLWIGEMTLRRFAYILWMAIGNRVWQLLHGRGYYQLIGKQKNTLTEELNLQSGELVEIKSTAEIEATLDTQGRNRGLSFEPEMARLCGRRFRVALPLRHIIAEGNGKMIQLGNTVILDGLTCQGLCANNCPRANYFYWREIWLKRV